MLNFILRLSIIGAVFAAPALAASEDEALQAFNSLYGDEVKRALATPDTADDLALAGKLLEAAKTVTGQPALLAVLCEKAAELGKATAGGRATAIQAMELVIEKAPDRKAACLDKIAALRQIDYDASRPESKAQAGEALIAALLALADVKTEAGEAAAAADACRKALTVAVAVKSETRASIQARLDSLAARQKSEQKIAGLKARLAATPTDAAARTELVMVLVVDLDDPAEAAKFVDASLDATLQKFVPAAAKGLDQTPELPCGQLGDWYRGLADQAAGAAKASLTTRARAYYKRFLSLHTTEDVAQAQVVLAMKKLDEAAAPPAETPKTDTAAKTPRPTKAGAAKAGATAAIPETFAANQWHDVLKYVDAAKDPVLGSIPIGWRRDGKTVVYQYGGSYYSSGPESKVTVPVMPQGNYDLQVMFAVSRTQGSAGIYLPVGLTCVLLRIYSNGYTASGLEYVGGQAAYSNGTGTMVTLFVNRVYTIEIRVTVTGDQANIAATLDGGPLVQWSGPLSALTTYDSVDRRCLGLHGYNTTVTYGSLKLRPAQEAAIYKPDAKGPLLARPAGTTSTRPTPGSSTTTPGSTPGATPSGSPAKQP